MLELIGNKQTVFLILTNIIAILVMRGFMKPAAGPPYEVYSYRRRICVLLCFVFCLFSFWGADWFGNLIAYKNAQLYGNEHSHYEEVYVWIIQSLPDGYLYFRTVVWGGALFLFFKTIKMLPLSFDLALLIFCSAWLPLFSYARVSLAMAIMFYGGAWYYSHNGLRGAFVKILSIAIVLVAIFFHKSAVFGVLAILIAIFSKKINRKWIYVYICLYPFMVYFVQIYMGDFMTINADVSEEGIEAYTAAGQNYLSADSKTHGLGTELQLFLEHLPLYILAYFCYKLIQSPIYIRIPDNIKIFIKSFFLIILMASVFMLDFGVNTDTIYSRLMRFSIIPGVIVLAYFYQNKLYKEWPGRIYNLAYFSMMYSLVYVTYTILVK